MLRRDIWRGLRSGFRPELQTGVRSGERIVGEHVDNEHGVAGTNFVAVGEEGFFHTSAVKESAVAALQVEDAAALFAVIDGEVKAGHELVVGKGMIGFGIAAEAQRHAGA